MWTNAVRPGGRGPAAAGRELQPGTRLALLSSMRKNASVEGRDSSGVSALLGTSYGQIWSPSVMVLGGVGMGSPKPFQLPQASLPLLFRLRAIRKRLSETHAHPWKNCHSGFRKNPPAQNVARTCAAPFCSGRTSPRGARLTLETPVLTSRRTFVPRLPLVGHFHREEMLSANF